MESILFGFCLIAVVWLIVWVERDATRPSERWWPFEMKGFTPPKKTLLNGWRTGAQHRRIR